MVKMAFGRLLLNVLERGMGLVSWLARLVVHSFIIIVENVRVRIGWRKLHLTIGECKQKVGSRDLSTIMNHDTWSLIMLEPVYQTPPKYCYFGHCLLPFDLSIWQCSGRDKLRKVSPPGLSQGTEKVCSANHLLILWYCGIDQKQSAVWRIINMVKCGSSRQ